MAAAHLWPAQFGEQRRHHQRQVADFLTGRRKNDSACIDFGARPWDAAALRQRARHDRPSSIARDDSAGSR
jgi:hypothetical protein